ncbi:MAG TPA: DUF3078 domain-containing protein [bacterium]|jgi:hypothetical protein|nr:DUF3078 domain-containing protein [bacterium]
MKKFLWVLIFFCVTSMTWAQTATVVLAQPPADEWKNQILANLNLNQGSFSNWVQGGINFITWQAGLNARFEKDNTGINWLNTLKLQYGLTYNNLQGTQVTSDTIDLESVYSWKTWQYISPYVSLSIQNQFGYGFNYTTTPATQTSNFMDPGYFTESVGLKYTPDTIFNTRLGAGLKETVANQFEAVYTQNQNVLTQLGISWVSELNLKFSDSSSFDSKLDTFWPGGSINLTVAEWDNLLTIGINKLLNFTMEDDFRYDSVIYNGIQVKELAGLGVGFSLL